MICDSTAAPSAHRFSWIPCFTSSRDRWGANAWNGVRDAADLGWGKAAVVLAHISCSVYVLTCRTWPVTSRGLCMKKLGSTKLEVDQENFGRCGGDSFHKKGIKFGHLSQRQSQRSCFNKWSSFMWMVWLARSIASKPLYISPMNSNKLHSPPTNLQKISKFSQLNVTKIWFD